VIESLRKPCTVLTLAATLFGGPLTSLAQQVQEQALPAAPQEQASQLPTAPQPNVPLATPSALQMPRSYGPFAPYSPATVAQPNMSNSSLLQSLVRDGKLYLSLQDAINLAMENNLDLVIARYNLPIADTDILRTKAGGIFRGVNTGIVQNTPGGGVGGFGAGAPGAGAGGTTGGAGGAGAGAAGIVESTLGTGTNVPSFDPVITGTGGVEHLTLPQANLQLNGVPTLQQNTGQVNLEYQQAFPTGTIVTAQFFNNRQTVNSIYTSLSPALNAQTQFQVRQPLLAGFGFGPNLRYLRIAKNNKEISDIAFRNQVIATVTQIENIYWDLVSAYEQARVNEQSLAFAQQSFDIAKKQLNLQAIPALDVTRAEAEVSRRDQDLTIARTNLQLQESLIKNALTKSLDDPVLEEMPVIPTDRLQDRTVEVKVVPILDLIQEALQARPELSESAIDLHNREITRKATRNALLPTVDLVASYGGTGLAGLDNPAYTLGGGNNVPRDFGGAFGNAFNGSAPDYYVGASLNIPLRNRVAKADQYRSELEYRQAEVRLEELKKQIRIEVRNARYALEQSAARVAAATKGRDLSQHLFEITQKEQQLGAASSFQTLGAQRDLALAELDFVNAMTVYEKARIELDRATGRTLEHNGIQVQDAINGTASSRK
jgi:outer membrane protein TolC